jgi:hypothetical protein
MPRVKIVPYTLEGKGGYRAVINGIPMSRKPVELERAIQQAEALKKSKKMKNVEEYALSDSDIKKMIPTLKVVSYPELLEASSIDDILDEKGRLMLLYLTEDQMTGHWVCLLKLRDKDIIEYFDPYGNYRPDEESEWVEDSKLKEFRQNTKHLTKLLKNSPYEVKSNAYKFQKDKMNMNTCGRHCTTRLYFKHLDLPKYIDLVESTGLQPDDFVSAFTFNLIGK